MAPKPPTDDELNTSIRARLALLGIARQRAKMLLLERGLTDTFSRCDVVVRTSPVPFDILGLPELALPIGFTDTGLPVGTILGGQPFAGDRLLSIATA